MRSLNKSHVPRVCGFLLFCLSECLLAQGQATEQIWFDFTDYFPVGRGLSVGGDVGLRSIVLGDEEWTAIYARPSFSYPISPDLNFSGGIGFFYAFRPGAHNATEIRPWGGTRYRWPQIGKLSLEHYFRAEGRFIRFQESPDPLSILRLRYRLGTNLPITDNNTTGRGVYLPLQYEFFMDAAGDTPARFVNHNRLVVGLGYRISKKWRIELQYTQMLNRTSAHDSFTPTAHVFRFRILG